MVFLQFPSALTEEEVMLQNKYAKLRRKKKQLAAIKNSGGSGGGGAKADDPSTSADHDHELMLKKKKKPIPEAKDAKEVAKKLIRSGAIAAIQKSVEKGRESEKSMGFKRSQGMSKSKYILSSFRCLITIAMASSGLERKLQTGSMDARAGYQPFSATHGPGGGFDTGGEDMNPEPPEPPKKVKNLYESFVSARDREERGLSERDKHSDKPRTGNTVYVFGYNVTEDIMRATFTAPNTKIVNISMEVEKNCGFVTFDKPEAAETAITEHNGSVVQGIELKARVSACDICYS